LADGTESVFDIYEAIVDWDGKARRIAVDEAETFPLVGMSLLEGYELTVKVGPGGNVTLRALPQTTSG
jgi:predicted aspartyl protease